LVRALKGSICLSALLNAERRVLPRLCVMLARLCASGGVRANTRRSTAFGREWAAGLSRGAGWVGTFHKTLELHIAEAAELRLVQRHLFLGEPVLFAAPVHGVKEKGPGGKEKVNSHPTNWPNGFVFAVS
jgi:hypothetical protein